MIMTMKKKEIIELNYILTSLKELGNTKFKYFVIKNISALKPHIEPLLEIDKENKEVLKNFEEERNTLILKLGKKGENDQVFIDVNDTVMYEQFTTEIQKLISKYKDDLEKYETNTKEFSTVLDEEVDNDLNLRTISIEDCPEEGIKGNFLEFLIEKNIVS